MSKITAKILLLFTLLSGACYADSYQLLVDNNTDEQFTVQKSDKKSVEDLKPHEQAKEYIGEWQTSRYGEEFTVWFHAQGLSDEIFVIGIKNALIRCNTSLSLHYRCEIEEDPHQNVLKVIISMW